MKREDFSNELTKKIKEMECYIIETNGCESGGFDTELDELCLNKIILDFLVCNKLIIFKTE